MADMTKNKWRKVKSKSHSDQATDVTSSCREQAAGELDLACSLTQAYRACLQ